MHLNLGKFPIQKTFYRSIKFKAKRFLIPGSPKFQLLLVLLGGSTFIFQFWWITNGWSGSQRYRTLLITRSRFRNLKWSRFKNKVNMFFEIRIIYNIAIAVFTNHCLVYLVRLRNSEWTWQWKPSSAKRPKPNMQISCKRPTKCKRCIITQRCRKSFSIYRYKIEANSSNSPLFYM